MSESGSGDPLSGVDLAAWQRLVADERIWTLDDVQEMLGLARRTEVARLWRTTCNYLYGGHREWPPSRHVRTRLLPRVTAEPVDVWLPPHQAILPVPDIPGEPPRWLAGTLLRWGMQTGRLSLTDQTPRVPNTPPGRRPKRADISGISQEPLITLIDDDRLWTIEDIQDFFQVSEETANRWYRRTRNRYDGGVTSWPPPPEERHRITPATQRPGLTWWPAHERLLPPPATVKDTGRRPYLWRAGDVKLWGLQVGRLRHDGTIANLH